MGSKTRKLPYFSVPEMWHFEHAELVAPMAAVYPGVVDDEVVPVGQRRRKRWEIAMAVRALQDFGAAGPDARVLGVGAGLERTGFYLSNHVEQVYMTDLYGVQDQWGNAAPVALRNLDAVAPMAFNRQRVVVQHMDMRDLRYPDNFFDGIYSSSSIEHLPTFEDVAAAAREIGRVVRPGGVITLATEWKIDGDENQWPGVLLFDSDTLREYVIEPSGCEPVERMRTTTPDDETLATRLVLSKATATADQWDRPHLVFINRGITFTSVFITLRKPE